MQRREGTDLAVAVYRRDSELHEGAARRYERRGQPGRARDRTAPSRPTTIGGSPQRLRRHRYQPWAGRSPTDQWLPCRQASGSSRSDSSSCSITPSTSSAWPTGADPAGGRPLVDQAEQACRLASATRTEETVEAGPARQVAGGPDGDRCHQPPTQPAGRVATLRRDGEGRLQLDADGFPPGGHASKVPASPSADPARCGRRVRLRRPRTCDVTGSTPTGQPGVVIVGADVVAPHGF